MSDVTGKGASLRELIADKIAKAVNEQLAACGSHRMVWAGDNVPFRYSAEILALTHPTEPPSAGREVTNLRGALAEIRSIVNFEFGEMKRKPEIVLDPLKHIGRIADEALLAAAPSPEPQPSVRLDREEIAEIIAGECFGCFGDRWRDRRLPEASEGMAFAAADAIISSARSGGE